MAGDAGIPARAGIAVAVGVAFNPEDPLGCTRSPLGLAGARHGGLALWPAGRAGRWRRAAVGIGSPCMWVTWTRFPQIFFLGGLITVMLVGEFSSLWRARTRRAEAVQYYLDQRLEHLIRQYYLLRLSHDRLEQELIGRPMSMRDALEDAARTQRQR